jgi:hypothetical protein
MSAARYFIPEHPQLTDVYSRAELRALLQAGKLSRSDMVTDDETGIAHLLGDLLATPFPDATMIPVRSTSSLQPHAPPRTHEFRADTPLPRAEHEAVREVEDDNDGDEVEDDGEQTDDVRDLTDDNEEEIEEDDQEQEQEQDPDEDAEEETDSESVADERAAARTLRIDGEGEEPERDPDEELLYIGHPSWFAFPKALFLTAVCIGAAVFFRQHNVGWEWITLLGSIAGLILLFISLDRTTTTYFVTSKRVELEVGIIGRSTKEVRICDIRAIDVLQQGFDAVVGLGTVRFDSAAGEGPEISFRNVRRPHDIKQLVRDLQG